MDARDSSKEAPAFDYNDGSVNVLIAKAKKGDDSAYAELIKMFEPYVMSIAKKYLALGDFDDIMQSGRLGLVLAVNKYDPDNEKGARFHTYAYWSVKGEIIKYINENSPTVSMSQSFRQFALKVIRTKGEIESETGTANSTSEQIQERLEDEGIEATVDSIELAISSLQSTISLDQSANKYDSEDDRPLADKVSADDEEEGNPYRSLVRGYVDTSGLDQRELIIYKAKQGFNDENRCYSTKELVKMMNLSDSRIMQLYRRADVKIRKHLLRDGYKVKIR